MRTATKTYKAGKTVHVGTGSYFVSRHPTVYHCAGVGSCVVLFVYEPVTHLAGTAHIDLPPFWKKKFTGPSTSTPALLINKLMSAGARKENLRAKIMGGANLFDWEDVMGIGKIGEDILRYVRNELLAHKIYIANQDIGGSTGQNVKCYSGSGEVHIRSLTKTRVI